MRKETPIVQLYAPCESLFIIHPMRYTDLKCVHKFLDEDFMRLALQLAELGRGFTRPNPMVGSVIVKNGRIVGVGYHKMAGLPHAERVALADAGEHARGGTIYVTLEPCTHYGRTPPCADAIIEAGLKRAVIATLDPNPVVHGRGVEKLRAAGLDVTVGVLEEEARELNEVFFKFMETGRPFVALKLAMTLDGFIADSKGRSMWITNSLSRRYVHKLRGEYDAIVVGVGTVMADDPMLTARDFYPPLSPARIVLDSWLRTPLDSRLVMTAQDFRTVIVTTEKAAFEEKSKVDEFVVRGVEVWPLRETADGRVDLHALIEHAASEKIQSMLFEGGSAVAGRLIAEDLVDKLYIFTSPKIIGQGIPAFGGLQLGIENAVNEMRLSHVEEFDGDVLKIYHRKRGYNKNP